MLVAPAVAARFGEKFVSVCSERVPCDWARSQDPPLLLLSTLCVSLPFRLGLFGWSSYPLASAVRDNNVQGRVLASVVQSGSIVSPHSSIFNNGLGHII